MPAAFSVDVEHEERDLTVTFPGAPYILSQTPWTHGRRAPLLGEHTREILCGQIGLSADELGALVAAGSGAMSKQPARRRRRRRPARPTGSAGESEVGRRSDTQAAEETSERGRGGGKRSGGGTEQPQRRTTIFGMPRMTVALLGGLMVAMIAVFAMQLIFPPEEVAEVQGVQTFPDQGRRHLDEGETFSPYNSSPPTSGPQPAEAPAADVYLPDAEFIPDPAQMLPLLERGGVVIYYDPAVYTDAEDPSGLLGAMQSLRQFRERLAVVPINGLADQHDGATIVVAAWRTLLPITQWDAEGNDQLTAFLQNAPEGYYDRYRLERGDPAVSASGSSE